MSDDIFQALYSGIVDIFSAEQSLQAIHRAAGLEGGALSLAIEDFKRLRSGCVSFACEATCHSCCDRPIITCFPVNLIAALLQFLSDGNDIRSLDLGKGRGCAFFIDGRCTVYAMRPSVCRLIQSTDRSTCDSGAFDRRIYGPLVTEMTTAITRGTGAAMERLGLEHRLLDLNQGLRLLVADPTRVERWLTGAPVFGAVALCSDG